MVTESPQAKSRRCLPSEVLGNGEFQKEKGCGQRCTEFATIITLISEIWHLRTRETVSPSYLGIMNMLAGDSARHCDYPPKMCFSWWERMNPLTSQGVSLLTHLPLLVRSYFHLLILLSFPLSALRSSALPNLCNSQPGLQSAFSLPCYGITPPPTYFNSSPL